jgi:hypothetical protein
MCDPTGLSWYISISTDLCCMFRHDQALCKGNLCMNMHLSS